MPASLLLKRRLHVRSTPMSSVGWSEGASTLILHASKMSSGVKSLSQSTVGSAGAAGASAAAEALGAALALGASDAALSDGFTTGTTGVREAELELGVGLAAAGLSLDETCDARPSGAGAGSSRHPDRSAVNRNADPRKLRCSNNVRMAATLRDGVVMEQRGFAWIFLFESTRW